MVKTQQYYFTFKKELSYSKSNKKEVYIGYTKYVCKKEKEIERHKIFNISCNKFKNM